MMRGLVLATALSCAVVTTAQGTGDSAGLRRELDNAVRRYDLSAATAALSEIRAARTTHPTSQLAEIQVRASLAVAELLRLEYERVGGGDDAGRRRLLGQRIDATAEEGLGLLDELPETSEHERLRADLIATMIRSDYRAQKYEAEFKSAVARALELEQRNAKAWVSAAKPFLFAPLNRGRDVEEAIRLLDSALKLEPGLESALLLRAYAHDQAGDDAAAERDWRAALKVNPDCKPALERLQQAP